jgi:hypothetical protein
MPVPEEALIPACNTRIQAIARRLDQKQHAGTVILNFFEERP